MEASSSEPFPSKGKNKIHVAERANLPVFSFGLMGVLGDPSAGSSKIPAIVYAIYQVRSV